MAEPASGKFAQLGKGPVRALETFGVAGLLDEKAKVFYSSLFTTKHVGRVADLVAAKLHDEGLDELRLRAILLFGAFEVFRAQAPSPDAASKHRLSEPLVLECGLDEDKIAVGVSFNVGEDRYPNFEGLADRIAAGKPENDFERLLGEMHAHADRTVVRSQAAVRRIEIVVLLGIPGKIDPPSTDAEARTPVTVVRIGADQKADPPKVESYVELGDLDYPTLLQESAPGQGAAPPATGEVLVHGCKETDAAVQVRAASLLEAITGVTVGASQAIGDDAIRVKGRGPEQDNSTFKVTGGGAIQASDGAVIVKGTGAAADAGSYSLKSYAMPQVDASSDAAQTGAPGIEASGPEAGESGDVDKGKKRRSRPSVVDRIKQAWPFRFGRSKKADDEPNEDDEDSSDGENSEDTEDTRDAREQTSSEEVEPLSSTQPRSAEDTEKAAAAPAPKREAAANPAGSDPQGEPADTVEDAPPPPAVPAQAISISTADIEKEAQKLTNEIENGIEKTVNRASVEANDLKQEMGSTRAKRWVDGLMSELVAEKARLAEASKALNTSIRQKEHEFRSKEQLLTEELKRRDDMIRQKTNALQRVKEQLAQANATADKLKGGKQGGGDDVNYKQKYNLVQKMLTSAKDENSQLVEKIDDLKNQLMSAQLNSSKRGQVSMTDFTALQGKFERAMRQSDELKRANQQLADKLAEAKKERVTGSADEVKKRLEAAMKMANNYQRDSERLQQRIEDMQREQIRLKGELNKSQAELKSARVGAGGAAKAAAAAAAAAKPPASAAAKGAAPTKAPAPAAPAAAAAKKPPAGGQGTPPKAA